MYLQDVDIVALVKFMSEVTGKNFVLDERVHGKLTIISPTKMSIDEPYGAFQPEAGSWGMIGRSVITFIAIAGLLPSPSPPPIPA
jgi:hypothetical protein